MEYSYKFRVYPTAAQARQIQRTFGCCRFVWNHYLALRKDFYEQDGKTMNYSTCSGDMTQLKKTLPWLREVDATALQSSLRDLDTAYQNFFRRVKQGQKPGYPKFKSKHHSKKSYKSKCVGTNIKVLDKAVQLPKLGFVKCRISKDVKGRILSATVSQNPSGEYFVALCCTDVEIVPLTSTGAVAGIDMGLKAFAITSDGVEYPNHKYLTRNQKKLAKLQRQLSRKSRGSNRREKARIQVARLHEHVSNQRQDMLHRIWLRPIWSRTTNLPGLFLTQAGASFGGSWSTKRRGTENRWSRSTASFRPVSFAPLAVLNGQERKTCPSGSGLAPSAALSMTGM